MPAHRFTTAMEKEKDLKKYIFYAWFLGTSKHKVIEEKKQ